MSEDGYFDGVDDFDEEALGQLDAIEAAHFSPAKKLPPTPPFPASRPPLSTQDSFYDLSLDVNENELAQLDTFIEDAYEGRAQPVAVAGPSKFGRSTSSNKLQTTLFGDIIQPVASSSTSKPKSTNERTKSAPRNPFGQQAPKTKKWDQTAFAKSGGSKGKGKGKAQQEGDGEGGEDGVEFEQFPNPLPPPFVPIGPPPPMKLKPDLLEAKHWIYPINHPKRDYQYNIVKNCLFNNTLVALPTGLGKTLIAGVVMLNYYRWFPEGKVVFVAPTKPLVAQQVNACLETCGIPGRDSVELTGEVPRVQRVKHWAEKRVFFMTPQTLQNDLEKMVCDARDIVLLVVDEAHRATGDYAYNRVIRFLMATNPYFRVLALTATPGNKYEAIQILIDGLHISHIELRDDQSLDLQPYIHRKVIKTHIINANEDVGKIRDMIANVMDPIMKTLKQRGLLNPSENPISMHPYRPQMVMKELRPNQAGFYASLAKLSSLARGMMYLLTGSIGACYESLKEASRNKEDDDDESGKKDRKSKSLRDDSLFKILMLELETQRNRGFGTHPKVEKLKELLIQHFGSKISDDAEDNNVDDTRVMVFSSYRAVVDEIVEELSRDRPLIRAARFIGQGVDKQGNKGLPQKEQLEVIKKFKAGEYNVLVATSIGEEGLDIGEIDITICYDADKAPTRMVQRFGRTGRKRAGMVHALLAEGREENNIDKADAAHKEVNKIINKGQLFELYGDVYRLLPDHIKPECLEKVVEIEAYVREEKRKRGSPKTNDSTQAKRKRNDDVARNIPDGASTGFVSVRDLLVKAPKKRKSAANTPKNFETCAEDDEADEDIASGRVLARRTQSVAASGDKPTSKVKLRKSATIGGTKATKARRTKKKVIEPTPSQFSKQGADDSDDLDIAQGAILPANTIPSESILQPSPQTSPTIPVDSVLEISDSEPAHMSLSENPASPLFLRDDDQDMGWIVDDDDDNLDFEIVDSSPLLPKRALDPPDRMQVGNNSIEISVPQKHCSLPSSSKNLADDSVEFVAPVKKRTISKRKLLISSSPPEILSPPRSPDAILAASGSTSFLRPITPSPVSSPYKIDTSPASGKVKASMLPPALPRRFLASPAISDDSVPEPSFPVRPIGANIAKKRRNIFDDDEPESPSDEMPAPSQRRRIHRLESTPPVRRTNESRIKSKSKRAKPSLLSRNPNGLFDGEAIHSGDEVSEGRSGTEDEESESDRLFLKDSPATQASQSYNQSLVYRQSLLTQAPANNVGIIPMFSNRPIRHKPFGRIDGARSRRLLPSSSPPPPDEDLDHYDLDSFVVDDDEEIS